MAPVVFCIRVYGVWDRVRALYFFLIPEDLYRRALRNGQNAEQRRTLLSLNAPLLPLYGKLEGCADATQHLLVKRNYLSVETGNMELDRRLLLAHCAAHVLSIAAGLLVVVPIALNGSAFKGRCALFSSGYWRTENSAEVTEQPGDVSHLVVQQWGPPAACQFATFVGIFTVLYGAVQGWRCLFYLHGRHDE